MTLTFNHISLSRVRNRARSIVEIVFDSSYPTGGEAVTANDLKLNTLETVNVLGAHDQTNDVSYQVRFDRTNSKLQVFGDVFVLSRAFTAGAMTDSTSTTGYIDFSSAVPALAIPVGWKAVTTAAFTGNTSATIMVGISGDTDRYSADTSGSVFTTGTVGSLPIAADALKGIAATVTPRITVTGADDFTNIATTGAATVYFYYKLATGIGGGAAECPSAYDLSALTVTVEAIGY